MGVSRAPSWFEVDKKGLAALIERRGKASVILEVIQNALDAPGVSVVEVTLEPHASRPGYSNLVVRDDSPEGFKNLEHAYTLFADSSKKSDPTLRGRFNLGEKMVLSLCHEAAITSTTGQVKFTDEGRRRRAWSETERAAWKGGTVFTAAIALNADDRRKADALVESLIVPKGVNVRYNARDIQPREMIGCTTASLVTEIRDDQGVFRRSVRKTTVEFYEPKLGESAMLYEMGIPVCTTGDRWHANVMQKVPLSFERDAVTASYLRDIRAAALNAGGTLSSDAASEAWVVDALADETVTADAVRRTVTARFGEKVVAFDPSDPEANKLATVAGYKVVHGGSLSREAWDNVRAAGAILPAGKVTPSPKPYSPDGTPLVMIPESEYTPGMVRVVRFAHAMARATIRRYISVAITNDSQWPFVATFGKSGTLVLNLGCLGRAWFTDLHKPERMREVIDLFIHEFGHHYESDHLSDNYYRALTRIGAETAVWLATDPAKLDILRAETPEPAPCRTS